MTTHQYGVLIKFRGQITKQQFVSMDDGTCATYREAFALAMSFYHKYPKDTVLSIYSINMETGELTQIKNRAEIENECAASDPKEWGVYDSVYA